MGHVILFSAIGLGFLTRKSSKIVQSIPFVVLFLFAALRYMYGNDYSNYYHNYYLIQVGGEVYKEPLFVWLNQVFPNFYLMIAVISFFYIAVIYWLVAKNVPTKYVCFGIFIFIISPYLFLINLSAIRQCIAMLFFIAAVRFAIKKNYIAYILLLLLAMQFHQSAVILIPFLLLINEKRFDKKRLIIYCVVLAALLVTDSFSAIIENFAAQFEDGNYLTYAQSETTNSLRATLLSAIYLVYVLLNIGELEGKALIYSKLYLISPTLSILAIRLSTLTRMQMYFDIFAIVALPLMFKHNFEKGKVKIDRNNLGTTIIEIMKRYVLPALIIVVYLLRYYSFFTNPTWESFSTYQTIFSANPY